LYITRLFVITCLTILFNASTSWSFEGFNLYARPAIGVSWFKLKSMEIDRDFVTYTEGEENDGDPWTTDDLEELTEEDIVAGAKSFYTGSGFTAGISAGLKIRALGLGVHYAWAGIKTNKGKEGDKKTGGYYKEYIYSAEIKGAYGPQIFQQGTIKVKRVLFEMSYGLPFWKFELMFITRIGTVYIDEGNLQVGVILEQKDHGIAGDLGAGLALYPLDFFGFGLNGFGGFYSFTGKYEGAYGVLSGLTGFIVLQI
jgi:hypothetical protein